jgi:hypothetical protein
MFECIATTAEVHPDLSSKKYKDSHIAVTSKAESDFYYFSYYDVVVIQPSG